MIPIEHNLQLILKAKKVIGLMMTTSSFQETIERKNKNHQNNKRKRKT
jgi:hypothetical protein